MKQLKCKFLKIPLFIFMCFFLMIGNTKYIYAAAPSGTELLYSNSVASQQNLVTKSGTHVGPYNYTTIYSQPVNSTWGPYTLAGSKWISIKAAAAYGCMEYGNNYRYANCTTTAYVSNEPIFDSTAKAILTITAYNQNTVSNEFTIPDAYYDSYKYIFVKCVCGKVMGDNSCGKDGQSFNTWARSGAGSFTIYGYKTPVVSGVPVTKTIKSGSNTMAASIINATSQVWQLSLDNGSTWTNLDASPYRNQFSGYNTNELTITPIGLDLDNSLVRVVATNSNGSTTSTSCSLQFQKDTFTPKYSSKLTDV